ncbi:hypothetical protein MAR_001006, partial [Mya arenaria]
MEEGIAILVVNDKKKENISVDSPSKATFKDRKIYDFDRDLLTSIVKTCLGFECICHKNEHENIGVLNSNREEFEATREHLTACAEAKTVHVDKKTGKKEEVETTKNINSGGNDAHLNKDLSVDDLAHSTGIKDPKECGCLQCKVRVKAGKSEAKYFLCAINSHGAERKGQMSILFSDEQFFPLNDIIEKFSDKACPELKGKIKIFIIQACRGDPKRKPEDRIDKGVEVQIANNAADSKQTDSAETKDFVDMEDSPETGQISIATGSIPPNTLLIFS